MNLGNKLKLLREEKNLTQEKLSGILNINRVQYCQYENDYFNIPIKHLISLSEYFDVSIDYLLDLSISKQYIGIKNADTALSGNRLKEFRKEHKLTQKRLAEILHTTYSNLAFYDKGRNFIATPFLYQICHKYQISADYLLGRI